MQIDATAIIVAFLGAAATILAVAIPLKWGRKAGEKARSGAAEPSRELQGFIEQREHDRTREMIRDQTSEIRSMFGRIELFLIGRTPVDLAARAAMLDAEPNDDDHAGI